MNKYEDYYEEYERLLSLTGDDIRTFDKTYPETTGIYRLGYNIYFYKKGFLHREEDLPAFFSQTEFKFCFKDRAHRSTGPAILNKDGSYQYQINGYDPILNRPIGYNAKSKKYIWGYGNRSKSNELNAWCKECGIDLSNISEEQQILINIKLQEYKK